MNESAKKIIALDLPEINPLPEHIAKYFKLCEDKLGMVPNVLKAYAFNETKLNAFTNNKMHSTEKKSPMFLFK